MLKEPVPRCIKYPNDKKDRGPNRHIYVRPAADAAMVLETRSHRPPSSNFGRLIKCLIPTIVGQTIIVLILVSVVIVLILKTQDQCSRSNDPKDNEVTLNHHDNPFLSGSELINKLRNYIKEKEKTSGIVSNNKNDVDFLKALFSLLK